ncbi:MAG: serine/threonine-protein kinase [Actinomycetota bacterium]
MAEFDLGIDDLERFQEIGSGGFATVYVASDVRFRRQVAVKVLHSLDEAGRRRFERELGLMGQFDDHAHIVTPYRSGFTAAGAPYLVMEYLPGGSLEDRIRRDGPLSVDAAVAHAVPIARALDRAHSDGVLHRDVKPANILLTADDVPKLTDFGIATIREATSTQLAFTLAHSPPETFEAGYDARDERSDLYSLASSLFTAIVGREPFAAEHGNDSQLAYLRRIEAHRVPPVGHAGIDEVLGTAMAKEPSDRYATAADFIDALTAATAPGAMTTVADGTDGGVDRSTRDSVHAPSAATVSAETDPSAQTVSAVPWPTGTVEDEEVPGRSPGTDTNDHRARGVRRRWIVGAVCLLAVVAGLAVVLRPGQNGDGSSSAESAAVPMGPLVGLPITYNGHTEAVWSVAELRGGLIASAGPDGTVQVWDPADAETTTATYAGHVGTVWSIAELDGGLVASAGADTIVHVWDPADTETTIASYSGHTGEVLSVAELDDGLVASAGLDGTVQVWDPADAEATIATYRGHRSIVWFAEGLSGGLVVSGSVDGALHVWDPSDPDTTIGTYTGHEGEVWSVTELDGGLVASAGLDGTVQVWDPADPGITIATYRGHGEQVWSVTELDDGLVASADFNGVAHVWDPSDVGTTIARYSGHTEPVRALESLSNGLVASAGVDGTVQIWDPRDP